jgi:hypothetical protein
VQEARGTPGKIVISIRRPLISMEVN